MNAGQPGSNRLGKQLLRPAESFFRIIDGRELCRYTPPHRLKSLYVRLFECSLIASH